ncbi:phosphate butyryltransferase [candidate division WOR-3 bacterium]|nr:phosphate butyryltransferase [candidate division WOR-3 bacterium]
MIKTMKELIEKAKEIGPKTCLVAGAYKESEILAANKAKELGIIKPVFVGDPELPESFPGVQPDDVIPEPDPGKAAIKAVQLCSEGKGDILLKGSVSTSQFLKPVLDAEFGLKSAPLLSHIVVLDIPGLDRLLAITDGGMCIAPNLDEKVSILKNGIKFMHSLGNAKPKVGILSAIEVVNPKIENTIDASIIQKAAERGQLGDCIVDGPLAFDLMVSDEACKIKGIKSPACGNVDLILAPDITCGNSVAKALIHLGGAQAAGAILGTKKPVVMLSRADQMETKLNSIALGVVIASQESL